ncbi:CAAX prenyl protease [Microbotryomycetes sp. JL221]|nr:CAAX prenyl protease [Microbotryomycetes sp. JL221]
MQLLSPATAALLSSTYTCLYVGAVILVPPFPVVNPPKSSSRATVRTDDPRHVVEPVVAAQATTNKVNERPNDSPIVRDRNDPAVIKSRLVAVTIATVVSLSSSIHTIMSNSTKPHWSTILSLLGLGIKPPLSSLSSSSSTTTVIQRWTRLVCIPLGLTASLFFGSLYISWLTQSLPGQQFGTWQHIKREYLTWQGLRNFVWGPLTEEVVFRTCIVSMSSLSGMSRTQLVFVTPLYFGLAHVHHAYESYVNGGRTSQALKSSLLQTAFQFTYTTVFGWYASFLFLRTGSIVPPLLSHTFCNVMGLPPLAWALRAFPERQISLWTSYVVGMGTFTFGLWRWTEPGLYGGSLLWSHMSTSLKPRDGQQSRTWVKRRQKESSSSSSSSTPTRSTSSTNMTHQQRFQQPHAVSTGHSEPWAFKRQPSTVAQPNQSLNSTSINNDDHHLPQWLKHRQTMKQKFPNGWQPPKRVSRQTMNLMKTLHQSNQTLYTLELLSEHFKISKEAVRRILKSKFELPLIEIQKREEKRKQERKQMELLNSTNGTSWGGNKVGEQHEMEKLRTSSRRRHVDDKPLRQTRRQTPTSTGVERPRRRRSHTLA